MLDEARTQVKSLFVSAGHSNTDPGATGVKGLREADLVLELRDSVVETLQGRGLSVTADGSKGDNLPLREACRMAEKHDVAVELHFNAFSSASAHGTEVLSDAEDKAFAAKLSKYVSRAIGTNDRGAKPENSGQHSRLGFIRAGGSILEVAFITSSSDIEKYNARYKDVVNTICDVLEEEVLGGYS